MNPHVPEDGIEVGGDVDEVRVSLRVSAPDLDPDAITRIFGVQPTYAARKDHRRLSGGGYITQRTGIWILTLAESSEWTLGDAIAALLDKLPSQMTVWYEAAKKGRIDLFCGLHLAAWNRGLELSPELPGRLSERQITLGLDIYCEAPDDEADA